MSFLRDLKIAIRSLARAGALWITVAVTLALGIGANAAIFSVFRGVLLRPLPYRDPDRLALIWNRMVSTNFPHAPVAAPDIIDFRTQAASFEAIAVTNLIGNGVATIVVGKWCGQLDAARLAERLGDQR